MRERDSNEVRELRLEGAGLFLIVAILGAGLVGAFFVGRWYERSSAPPVGLDRLASDPLENVVAPGDVEAIDAEDVNAQAGAFDTIAGTTQAEPSRQTTPPPAAPAAAASKPRAQAVPRSQPQTDGGSFFVQIAAFRDRDAADQLVQRLSAGGYPVRIFSEDGMSGKLYKVRVGGYGTRDEAVTIAAELNTKGHEGAFPIKAK